MKITLEEVEFAMNYVASAQAYLREARHEARKIRSDDATVSLQTKYAIDTLRIAVEHLSDGLLTVKESGF